MPIRQRLDDNDKPVKDVWDIVVNLSRERGQKRERKSSTFRGTKRAAQAEYRRLQRLADEGKLVTTKLTTGAVFDRYLADWVQLHMAPMGARVYHVALTTRAPTLRLVPAAKLALHHLTAHETFLRTEARPQRGGRPNRQTLLSDPTIARYLGIVKSALTWAESVGLLPTNPARLWRISGAASAERPAFDRDQARRFLTAIRTSPWYPHLLVLITTNMRLSEVRGWRIEDVDLAEGTYRVLQQWQTIDGVDVRRQSPKSKAGKRGGGLSAPVVAVLSDWLQAQDDRKRFLGKRGWRDPEGGALVFAAQEGCSERRNSKGRVLEHARVPGDPFNGHSLRSAYYRILADHQLSRIRLHDLRHSWLNLQLEAGTPMHEASKLMGHSGEAITRNVYQHLTKALGKRAADRFWAYLHEKDAAAPDETTPPALAEEGT